MPLNFDGDNEPETASIDVNHRGAEGRFKPLRFLAGGHRQTLAGQILRRNLEWPHPNEDVYVEVEPGIELLLRATWQRDAAAPALLLVHGLEGCDQSPSVVSTGVLAFSKGWHVIRMNMRGCGDSLKHCPRLYNAGLRSDLVRVAQWLAGRVREFCIASFSLGANLSLLTLARDNDALPPSLRAVSAVSPPLEMSRCADALEASRNWIYQAHFMRSLRRSYRIRQRLSPQLYEEGRERGIETVRAYDDAITAVYGGYADAEDYYRTVSAGPRLADIARPALILASSNDPFIPADNLFEWARPDHVRIICEPGGHVGFVGSSEAPRWFWAGELQLEYLRRQLESSQRRRVTDGHKS